MKHLVPHSWANWAWGCGSNQGSTGKRADCSTGGSMNCNELIRRNACKRLIFWLEHIWSALVSVSRDSILRLPSSVPFAFTFSNLLYLKAKSTAGIAVLLSHVTFTITQKESGFPAGGAWILNPVLTVIFIWPAKISQFHKLLQPSAGAANYPPGFQGEQ